MSQLKIPLISFSVAFLLSALLAFFSGGSWLGIVFKASVSAFVVAVFFFLAKMLLTKYVPELFESSDSLQSNETPIVGSNLDIRIGDEPAQDVTHEEEDVNLGSATFESGDESDESQKRDHLKDDENAENSPFGEDAILQPPDSLNLPKTNGEATLQPSFTPTSFAQDAPSSSGSSPSSKQQASQQDESLGQSNSSISNVQDVESSEGKKTSPNTKNVANAGSDQRILDEELKESVEKDVDRLEELPDLQEFVDSSNLPGNDSKAEELMNTGTQSFFANDVADGVTDSKLMANAIRTVLRRES